MDEIKIVNYSLIALLIFILTAFIYTCKVININSYVNEADSKVVAGMKA